MLLQRLDGAALVKVPNNFLVGHEVKGAHIDWTEWTPYNSAPIAMTIHSSQATLRSPQQSRKINTIFFYYFPL